MTFDRDDLRAAVSADILSAQQAARLEQFFVSRKGGHAVQDGQESLRFLSNFNDIFITLGLVILFSGITTFVGLSAAPAIASGSMLAGLLVSGPVALLAWLMLEYFCARRRMLLPSMMLTIVFVASCATAGASVFASTLGEVLNDEFFGAFQTAGRLGQVSFGAAALAALAVFLRFRLPFSLAVLALAAAGLVYISFGFGGRIGYIVGGSLSLMLGIATMLAGIWFDIKDPARVSRASDHAFWLHLTAAPQIIAGVSTMVTGSNIFAGSTSATSNSTQAITLLFVLIALGIVSLALNRRALIAASILTFMFTLTFVLNRAGVDGSTLFILVAIIIGGGVVLLGAGWKTARRMVLFAFPKDGIWARVFPPELA